MPCRCSRCESFSPNLNLEEMQTSRDQYRKEAEESRLEIARLRQELMKAESYARDHARFAAKLIALANEMR